MKEASERPLPFKDHVTTQLEVSIREPEKKSSPGADFAATALILDFPSSRTTRSKIMLPNLWHFIIAAPKGKT